VTVYDWRSVEDQTAEFAVPLSSKTTWSLKTVGQIIKWLNDCLETHSLCTTSQDRDSSVKRLPARLLDTGAVSGHSTSFESFEALSVERMPDVRLCASATLPEDTKYLTLSHRWGDYPAITLTNETLEAFHKSIPVSSLLAPEALTFKHSIEVTRSLGFRYLWIDALCINQEDAQEKSSEIAYMDEIYSNSTLNISATAASSGSDGLFYERFPVSVVPCRRQIKALENKSQVSVQLIAHTDRWDDEVDDGLINKRAWVFQERILSPRIIHFARDQVFWECASLRAADVSSFGDISLYSPYSEFLKRWYEDNPSGDLDALQTAKTNWVLLVTAYSGTKVTFPRDRLVAISAVARRICRLRNLNQEDYIAGLWRPGLARQLMWNVVAPWTSDPPPATYQAPSWSWASTTADGVVWHLGENEGPLVVDLIDVCISLKTSDVYGEITNGRIRLRGPVCKFGRQTSNTMAATTLTAAGKSYPRDLITTNWDSIPESLLEQSRQAQDQDIEPQDLYLMARKNHTPDYLYLMAFELRTEQDAEGCRISGLIMEPVLGAPGCYRRTGTFNVFRDRPGWDADFYLSFYVPTLQSNECLIYDGPGRYTIEII
jgi:hypothetical protein